MLLVWASAGVRSSATAVPRQRRLASTEDHGTDERVTLIDQAAVGRRLH
jgi:hypothetical protein